MAELTPDDKRWTLTMERERRNLVSRTHVKRKFDKDEQRRILETKEIRFPWGAGTARGYKL